MLNLTSQISVKTENGPIELDFVSNIEINSGWEDMTDVCEITLPKNIRRVGEDQSFIAREGVESLFKVGDEIDVSLGYDGNLVPEFSGYIRQVVPGLPVVLICEDGMFDFKRANVKIGENKFDFQTSENVDLQGMLEEIMEDTGLDYEINPGVNIDIKLGKFRIEKQTSFSEVLSRLKDFGLAVYTRGRAELYVLPPRLGVVENLISDIGLPLYIFTRNVISSNLEFVSKDLRGQQFLGISVDSKTNEKITFPEEPEENVNYTKINLPENMTVEQIKRFVEDKQQVVRYDGFEGSFLCFGQPYTRHGEAIKLEDPQVPDRNGDYLVKKTRVIFGNRGFRREIFLWRLANG